MDTIDVFVYGTLQQGGPLHSGYLNGIVTHARWATVPGRVWWVHERSGYPVARYIPDCDDRVVGQLLKVVHTTLVDQMLQMEQRAGYTIRRDVTVITDTRQVHDVTMCDWQHSTHTSDRIWSGDWAHEAGYDRFYDRLVHRDRSVPSGG